MVPGARLVVLGKQGAGKGTQCVRLSHHYVIPHIATGDMLRAAVKSGTSLGQEAQRYMDAGELIPDEVVLKMVAERLDQDDTQEPRLRPRRLPPYRRRRPRRSTSCSQPVELDVVVNLEVPTELVLRRLASAPGLRRLRRRTTRCKLPPRVDWICDVCGGEVVQREDDTEAAIKRRLDLYEAQTAPLIDRGTRSRASSRPWPATGTPDEVTDRLLRAIDERLVGRSGRDPHARGDREDAQGGPRRRRDDRARRAPRSRPGVTTARARRRRPRGARARAAHARTSSTTTASRR